MLAHELKCCCGRTFCEYLTHNHRILGELERDLHEAGKAGQALLGRYDKYILESDQERRKLSITMEILRKDKEALEDSNARIIEENRTLLDQLEEMNSVVAESDTQIASLKSTLNSTRDELDRLTLLSQKATQLEYELTTFEADRANMERELATNGAEKRMAVQGWKRAELTIKKLQDQIEMIELETCDEQGMHREALLHGAQRQVAVPLVSLEPEYVDTLRTSQGALNDSVAGDGVVTHFVKDILQDNSHLQAGILELRELLMASNSEVSNLRSQLELQQPAEGDDGHFRHLQAEFLTAEQPQKILETVPELHVHHHYHQRKQAVRKARRRRPMLAARDAPRSSSSSGAISSPNTTVSGHYPGWSVQSMTTEASYTPSSLSASPQHISSIFDSLDYALDSSTPGSSLPPSPALSIVRNDMAGCGCMTNETFRAFSLNTVQHRQQPHPCDRVVPKEHEPDDSSKSTCTVAGSEALAASTKKLQRTMSNENVISASGINIYAPARSFDDTAYKNPLSLLGVLSPTNACSTQTISSNTATISLAYNCSGTSHKFTKSLLSQQPYTPQRLDLKLALQKRFVEWLPRISNESTDSSTTGGSIATITRSSADRDDYQDLRFRSPGINQSGPIFGLFKPRKTPISVQPRTIDAALLQESLKDE